MIIGLATLILLLFTSLESPLLLKGTDKLLKEHIVDETRKERLLKFVDEGHKTRKIFVKEDNRLRRLIAYLSNMLPFIKY